MVCGNRGRRVGGGAGRGGPEALGPRGACRGEARQASRLGRRLGAAPGCRTAGACHQRPRRGAAPWGGARGGPLPRLGAALARPARPAALAHELHGLVPGHISPDGRLHVRHHARVRDRQLARGRGGSPRRRAPRHAQRPCGRGRRGRAARARRPVRGRGRPAPQARDAHLRGGHPARGARRRSARRPHALRPLACRWPAAAAGHGPRAPRARVAAVPQGL